MPAVRALGLSKRFGPTVALEGVDLLLDGGEVRGLLGPNGAGKTTLLRILLGLLPADEGRIEELDSPLAGFVEDPSFYPYLSGRANLEVLAELDDHSASVEEALAQVGLAERGEERVSGYSTGMRQRLGIAAALIRSPKLLLLDEPTSGLDPAGVRFVGQLVRSLSAQGVAVLLSSHQITEIEDVCDSFDVLSRGHVVWSGSARQMREQAPPSAHLMATSDDELALRVAADRPGVEAMRGSEDSLTVHASEQALDSYVLALAQAGVAVRRMELTASPLESMFFSLTGERKP